MKDSNNSAPTDNLNPTGMYGKVELITPEMAASLLGTMPLNRPLRSKRIERYCLSRLAGNWVLTHQGIAIDPKGRLRDGQHRLRMIVKTNKPTVLFVVYNVPYEAFIHMDEQVSRSVRDAIRCAEKGDFSCSMISVANIFEYVPAIDRHNTKGDRDYIHNVLLKYADAFSFTEKNLGGVHGCSRSIRALVARAWYHADHERLVEWCQILRTGLPENPQPDSAAIAYRNFLIRNSSLAGVTMEVEKYQKGQTALDYFLKRKSMSKIYGTASDLFPLIGKDKPDMA